MAHYTAEALGLLSRVSNLAERDYYLKRLAEELNVSEDALRGEWKKHRQKDSGVNNLSSKDQTNNINQLGVNPAEKMLISLMLQEQGVITLTQSDLQASDFEYKPARLAAEAIWEAAGSGRKVSGEALIDLFDDQRVHAFITGAATDPSLQGLTPEQAKRAAADCIDKIKKRKIARRRQELQRKLKDMKLDEQARNLLREQWQMITESHRSPYRSGGGEDFNG